MYHLATRARRVFQMDRSLDDVTNAERRTAAGVELDQIHQSSSIIKKQEDDRWIARVSSGSVGREGPLIISRDVEKHIVHSRTLVLATLPLSIIIDSE
jgi:hypothetical protein